MVTYFDIDTEYNKADSYSWADTIAREFLDNLEDAISDLGYKVITEGVDKYDDAKRETITTKEETLSFKRTYYCDFQIEDEDGIQSMWYRLMLPPGKAKCGVINLLTLSNASAKDFRGLSCSVKGQTDFLSSFLVDEGRLATGKPVTLRKSRPNFTKETVYTFKVLANPELVSVWCAAYNPEVELKENFFRVYTNVLSCIKLTNTTLNLKPIYMCNGLVNVTPKPCEIYVPTVARNQRGSQIQTGRLLLAAVYPKVLEWVNRNCILIPNFAEYNAANFEIDTLSPFHIFCEDKYVDLEKIETYGFLDSITATRRYLVAFIEDWGE